MHEQVVRFERCQKAAATAAVSKEGGGLMKTRARPQELQSAQNCWKRPVGTRKTSAGEPVARETSGGITSGGRPVEGEPVEEEPVEGEARRGRTSGGTNQ